MGRGQKAAAPEAAEDRLARVLAGALRDHGDERGQVFVFAAEAVADPSAHAGVAGLLVAGAAEGLGRIVVDRVAVGRFHEADVVGDALQVGQQVADPGAVLAAASAGPHGGDDRVMALAARHAGESLRAFDGGRDFLAVVFGERRFVIEQVDVREAAGLEEAEDALGFRCKVGERG